MNLTSALSIPGLLQLTQNSSTISPARPLNVTYLDPVPPPGLRVVIEWAPADEPPFDYRDVWLALVLYQSFLAGFGKNAQLSGGYRITMPISRTKMSVFGGYRGIQFGEAVWGIFQTGSEIARRYPNLSPVLGLTSMIYSTAGYRGKLTMRRPSTLAIDTNETSTPVATHMTVTMRRNISRAFEYGDSGIEISVDDPNLEIQYQFSGHPIPGGQMLTAFLRSVTHCSEYMGHTNDVHITAFSSDFFFRLQMDKMQVSGPNQLSWHYASLALRTLWMQIVMKYDEPTKTFIDQPRFESLSYKIEYKEVRIGQGWIG
ncbi:MAG: hypothetical protein Q9195_005045 [Heterodermia aff. obscurata]